MGGLGQVASTRRLRFQPASRRSTEMMCLAPSTETILILPPSILVSQRQSTIANIKTYPKEMLNIQINKWNNKNHLKVIFKHNCLELKTKFSILSMPQQGSHKDWPPHIFLNSVFSALHSINLEIHSSHIGTLNKIAGTVTF